MKANPKHNISSQKANDLLMDGLPLTDFYIQEPIAFNSGGPHHQPVIIENCIIVSLGATMVQFEKPVIFKNSHFVSSTFYGCYFLQGLIIHNCSFESDISFESGGHNSNLTPVIITDNEFNDFVNFFDCWYTGEFHMSGNEFKKGTNILSKTLMITFSIPPVVKDNNGRIDIENETSLP